MESDIIEEDVDDIFFPPAKPVRAASRPARAGRRAAMPSDEQESEAGGDQPTSYGIGMTHQNNANSQAEEGTADKVSGSGYSASTFAYNPSNRRRRTFLLGGLINKDPENEDDGKENFVDNSDSNFASDKQEKQPTSSSTSPQLREEAKQAYPQDRAYSSSHQQQGPAPSRFPEAEIQTSSLIGRHTNNAVAQPAQVAAPASETTRPNVQNASAGEAKHSLGSNGTMIGVGLNSMASASSMPAKGGFKFRFGGKSVVPSAGAGMGAISEEKSQQDSANLQVDANFLEGNRQITSSPTAGGPSVRSSHQSQHSFAPSRSEESSVSPETSKPRQKRDGDVRSFKSDRLRLLEEELNALEVTQKLSNAYVDDRGQDLKSKQRKMNEPRSAEIDVQAKVDTGLRHGNDSESIKAELLKAYKQAEEYRRQCERYKTQLDQFTNAYDEIARLKNLVAEKVKVISILEKERSSLNKVHRQYQKEYKGQESLEAEHAERMRRLNEELRISKAKVAKYKEIHSELESQLSRAEEKVRDFDQKNRQLREKLRAVTGSDKLSFDPIKMKAQLEDKDALIKKLEHDNLVLKRVAESSEKKLKAKSKEQALGHQDLREHCKFLEDEIENKNRELRENQVIIKKQQSQLKRMRLDIHSLQKLNQDRIKLDAILDEPIEESEGGSTFLTGLDRYGRNIQSHPPDSSNMPMDADFYRHSSADSKSASEAESEARSESSRQQSRKKVMAKQSRAGDRKKRSNFVSEQNAMVRLDDGWKKEEKGGYLAQKKPITPADMAGLYSKNKKIPTLNINEDVTDRKSMTYESLLSPDARKALDDARSWRSKQNSIEDRDDNIDGESDRASDEEEAPKASARVRERGSKLVDDRAQDEQVYDDEDFEVLSVADSQMEKSGRVHNGQDEESVEEDMDMLLAGLTDGN